MTSRAEISGFKLGSSERRLPWRLRDAANSLILKAACQIKGQLEKGHATVKKEFDGVEVCPFRNGARAAVVVSADFELCWAWQIRTREECQAIGLRERENVPYLVEILEDFGIPITWATVGHLFLENCSRGVCGRPHPEMPRPPQNSLWMGDWYRYDPCSDMKRAPGWYAPDLITRILASPVGHEVGMHSFSHIDFSPETSTPELVEKEISVCNEGMRNLGVRGRSLVFCFNHMGYEHIDLLARLGITAVRHRDKNVRLAYPERMAPGVYKLYESMNLRLANYYNYAEKARLFIDQAIQRGAAYHLWFHPSQHREVFDRALIPILKYLELRQKENAVWIATMGQLAAYCEARERLELRSYRERNRIHIDLKCDLDTNRYGETDITLGIRLDRPPMRVCVDTGCGRRAPEGSRSVFTVERDRIVLNVPCMARGLEIDLATP